MASESDDLKIDRVEVRPAFEWTCPECGTDHFGRMVIVEMTEELRAKMEDEHGVDDAATGDFVMCPETVECPGCGREFVTESYLGDKAGDEDDDAEEEEDDF